MPPTPGQTLQPVVTLWLGQAAKAKEVTHITKSTVLRNRVLTLTPLNPNNH
jgi:hypothetical protein